MISVFGVWLRFASVAAVGLSALSTLWGSTASAASVTAEERRLTEPSIFSARVWRVEDGLPRNSITALAKTSDGFFWVGMFDGLARFDGSRFRIFDTLSVPALKSHSVRSLHADSRGGLWIGTAGGGLTHYRDGQFVTYHTRDFDIASNYVGACLMDRNGVVYLGGSSNGITEFRDGRLIAYNAHPSRQGLRAISSLFEDSLGRVWAGSDSGLLLFQPDPDHAARASDSQLVPTTSGAPAWVWWRLPADAGLPIGKAVVIDEHPSGRLAVLFSVGQLYVEREAGSAQFDLVVDLRAELPEIASWSDTRSMAIGKDGAVWIGDQGAGLFRVNDGRAERFQIDGDVVGDKIWALLADEAGNVWVGGRDTGLVRLRPRVFKTYSTENGLSGDVIASVMEDSLGRIWVGTSQRGVEVVDLNRGVVRPVPLNGLPEAGTVTALFEASDGHVWIGTGENGMFRSENGRAFDARATLRPPINHFPRRVTAIVSGIHGEQWWGSYGQHVLHLKDGRLREVRGRDAGDALSVAYTRSLVSRADGGLWIGGRSGLLTMDADGRFSRLPEGGGLPSCEVYTLYRDRDGELWVGTYGQGLFRKEGRRFQSFKFGDSFVQNVVGSVLEDDLGYLWVGTMAGMHRILKSELRAEGAPEWRAFGLGDGLRSLEFSGGHQPTCWKAADGRLWFATANGVAVVDPSQVAGGSPGPEPFLENLIVDGRPVSRSRSRSVPAGAREPTTQQAVSLAHHMPASTLAWRGAGLGEDIADAALRFPSTVRRLEFRLGAKCFTDPEAVNFEYRLIGRKDAWQEAGRSRVVNVYDLAPGDYRFEFRARLFEQSGDLAVASVPFQVTPFFYETTGFRIGLALASAVLVIGGVRYLSRRRLLLQLQAAAHEKRLYAERHRISETLHDDLGANLTQIALLSDVSRRDAAKQEFVRSTSTRIGGLARANIQKLDEIVWAVNPKNDRLPPLVDYLTRTTQEFFEPLGVRVRFEFPDRVEDRFVEASVRHELLLAFKEGLANVAKHSGAAAVVISLERVKDRWRLVIEDSGRGFDVEASMSQGRGNGLRNIVNRARRVGGDARYESRPGQGARLILVLPPLGREEGEAS